MKIWDDPDAQRNGRGGQAQHGVDIYGTPRGETRRCGIQCKGKDARFSEALSEAELRAEVAKARTFVPPLGKFILATTVDNDQVIQQVAREITDEHSTTGHFSVHVYSWPEIHSRLSQYPELIEEFYGIRTRPVDVALGSDQSEAILANTEKLLVGHAALMQQLVAQDGSSANAGQSNTHAQLDVARDLIKRKAPKQALELLESIEEREWESAPPDIRFRIRTNRGAARLALGLYAEASADFLDAYEMDGSTDKAMANRALALMLTGRDEEARTAAREAVDRHPASPVAWSARINVAARLELDQPLPALPADLSDNSDVCFALGSARAARGDLSSGEALLRASLQKEPVSWIVQSRLAEVLLAQADSAGKLYVGASYTSAELAGIREATDLLQSAWDSIKLTDLAPDSAYIASNLSLTYWLLGEPGSARTILDEALPRAPNDPALLRQRVRLSLAAGDVRGARDALDRLTPETADDLPILSAQVLKDEGRGREALDILEPLILTMGSSDEAQLARCVFADMVCKVDASGAQARFARLPDMASANQARAMLIFAQSLREALGEAAARPYLSQARESLQGDTDERTQLVLAESLMEFGEYEAATAIFRQHVSPLVDTPSLRSYFRCLLELDQRQALRELTDALTESVRNRPYYQWLLGSAAIRVGDFAAARGHFERCFTADPGHPMARLRWAEVVLRQGDRAAVERWLLQDAPSMETLGLDELLALGSVYGQLDQVDEAARAFYEARRRFPNDPRAHLALVGAVLFRDRPQWQVGIDAPIAEDMAVGLNDGHGRIDVFIIEPKAAMQPYDGEIAPGSSLGTLLIGRTVGDVVTLRESDLASRNVTVAWAKHKFVHALHESMNSFNTRFPESAALVQVDLPKYGTPEQQLAPILRSVDSRADHRRQVLELYQSGQLPIAAVAQLLGRSVLDVWRSMIGPQGVQIATCVGTQQEREAAFAILAKPGRRYLIEPVSILIMHLLGVADTIVRVLGRLSVVQATLEEIRSQIAHHRLHSGGHVTIVSHEGQLYRVDVSSEEIAQEVRLLEALLHWTEANCDIVPAVPRNDLSPGKAQAMHDALGPAVYDSLLAASGADLVIISDDGHLRGLASGEFGIEGVWIQAVLMHAQSTGALSIRGYGQAVTSLAIWRHHFTSVSADQLWQAASDADWTVTGPFQALVNTLDLRTSEFQALVRVFIEFQRRLWRGRGLVSTDRAERLTYAALEGINPGASPRCHDYLRALAASTRSGQLPSAALRAVVGWYRGHFLLAQS
jgi:tetratricopeptide (TPR) repeat protein